MRCNSDTDVCEANANRRLLVATRSSTSKGGSGVSSARYDDVEFDFLNTESAATYTGTVVVRGEAMVLDLPAQEGAAPILIEGRANGHIYGGVNTLRREDSVRVNAKWTQLGDIFVGVWLKRALSIYSVSGSQRKESEYEPQLIHLVESDKTDLNG